MAVLQSSYDTGIRAALRGLIANMETQNTVTRLCEDDAIGFGKACFQGTADNEVTATPGTKFRGISVIDKTLAHTTPDQYEAGDNIGILTDGVIWVEAGETVTAGAAAYLDGDGNFAGASTGSVELPGCYFDSSGNDGDLVKLRVRA